jgi:aminoglycoside N3'-acetyltransferase
MGSALAVMQEDIVRGARELGSGAGDTVLVHSSLKSFGHVEEGPEAVIAGLLETVGREVPKLICVPFGGHRLSFPRTPSGCRITMKSG